MGLTIQDSQGLTLQSAIKKYVELRKPTTHIRGFFSPQIYDTTAIPIEIQRDNDYIAVDVLRGTGGKLNKSSISTMKTIVPGYYHEKFEINSLRNYERVFGQNAHMTTTQARVALAREVATELVKIQNKIIRAEELQCAQALESGIVVVESGENINYKRKADSLIDLGEAGEGGYWTTVTTDIEKQLQKAGAFIREEGATDAGTMNLTLSTNGWIALKKTNFFKNNANYNQVTLMSIGNPVGRAGANYHGQITAGSFVFNIWTYDGMYTNSAGTRVRFTDETKIIVTPTEGAQFELAYGALDTIVKSNSATNMSGIALAKGAADYYVWDNVDTNGLVHTINMTSAPCARLITVDQVVTMKIATTFAGAVVE